MLPKILVTEKKLSFFHSVYTLTWPWITTLSRNQGIFGHFSATRNLREINFGHFVTSKTAIMTIWAALNIEFFATVDIFECDIFSKTQNSKPPKLWKWKLLTLFVNQNWFPVKSEWQKMAKFPHCSISTVKSPNHAAQVCMVA